METNVGQRLNSPLVSDLWSHCHWQPEIYPHYFLFTRIILLRFFDYMPILSPLSGLHPILINFSMSQGIGKNILVLEFFQKIVLHQEQSREIYNWSLTIGLVYLWHTPLSWATMCWVQLANWHGLGPIAWPRDVNKSSQLARWVGLARSSLARCLRNQAKARSVQLGLGCVEA